jgi:protocatechuate 3,4-dioxygenase beta subunit
MLTRAPLVSDDTCVLTSQQHPGPFFTPAPMRKDVREDHEGEVATLKMKIVRMPDCLPVAGAVVEIWHCDAEGGYSGYPEELSHDLWKSFMLALRHGGTRCLPQMKNAFFVALK